jgi:hypothetical protein
VGDVTSTPLPPHPCVGTDCTVIPAEPAEVPPAR